MSRNVILSIVIVGCLGLVAFNISRYVESKKPTNRWITEPMFFRCEKCGHAFKLSVRELVAEWRDVPPEEATGGDKAHCDHCKGRFSSFQINEEDFARGDLDPRDVKAPPPRIPREKIPAPARAPL